ncbi:sugar transferase [Rhodobacterales bacterium FZCC0188]|nr:sugar transferase [Rhodobacterales bacterium FZCC0188]
MFDFWFAVSLIVPLSPLIVFLVFICWIDTRQFGIFSQVRIGFHGQPFRLYKLRTMKRVHGHNSQVTTTGDPRITPLGSILRSLKIDELPQLLNVIKGEMSLVGPRPDVPGFANLLEEDKKDILLVRPGITGPASLKYRNEEKLLATVSDPESYNFEVLWPDKVRINLAYIERWSMLVDIKILLGSVFPKK